MTDIPLSQEVTDLLELARSRSLTYPVPDKATFVAQMTRDDRPVTFRGQQHEAGFAARLIPDFFFPVQSERDLLDKTIELLVARGLRPFEDLPARSDGSEVP